MIYCLLVPSASPTSLRVMAITSTSAFLLWNPPSIEYRNGIVTGYTVRLIREDPLQQPIVFTTTNTNLTVSSLESFSQYRYTVSANTSQGQGPVANYTSFQTQQDGRLLKLVIVL